MRWTIGKKLITTSILIVSIILLLSSYSIFSSYKLHQNTILFSKSILPQNQLLGDINYVTENILTTTQKHILSTNTSYKSKYENHIKIQKALVSDDIKKYKKLATSKKEIMHLNQLESKWLAYLENNKEQLKYSNMLENEKAIDTSYEGTILFDKMQTDLDALINIQNKESAKLVMVSDQQFHNVFKVTSIFIILSLLLTVIISYLLIKNIRGPISLLTNQVREVASGNLALEPLKIKSRDEIELLANDFNSMTEKLRELILKIIDNSNLVSTTSEELSASARETSKASEQITKSVIEIAEGAELQEKNSNEALLAIKEINIGMEQAASSMQTVADNSLSTTEKAVHGSKIIEKTINQMKMINTTVSNTATIVDSLGEKSNEIENIVTMITEISEQTNLLALNASIEAARAGEQGKGFAVVANEVKKLAEQSKEAANQIGLLVENIQNEVKKVTISMVEGSHEIKSGIELVSETGENIKHIFKMIEEVSAQTQEVSAIFEEINASSVGILNIVETSSSISVTASEQSQTVAAAAQQQSATMVEVSSSANVLSKMATELEDNVKEFKI